MIAAAGTTIDDAAIEPLALRWWDRQRRWLQDRSRLRMCCKARQIGMSTTLATEALHAAVYGETTVIVSASQRQASELLRKAIQLLPLVTAAAEGIVRVDRQSAEAIELSTGGRVISLPASAATVQGYTGHVVIDEAAWIPDVDTLWMAIVPTISTRRDYRLSVVSTPGPRGGMFYRLWNSADDTWSRHNVTIYDACAGGAPHDIQSLRAAVADEATWRAAYECQFVDESHALLPYDLVLASVDETLAYPLNAKTLCGPGDRPPAPAMQERPMAPRPETRLPGPVAAGCNRGCSTRRGEGRVIRHEGPSSSCDFRPIASSYLALNLARTRVHGGHFQSVRGNGVNDLRIWVTRARLVVTSAPVKSWPPWSLVGKGGRGQRVKGLEPSTFTLAT